MRLFSPGLAAQELESLNDAAGPGKLRVDLRNASTLQGVVGAVDAGLKVGPETNGWIPR